MSARRHKSTRTFSNQNGYRGIEWKKKNQRYAAVIWPDGEKRIFLGFFRTAVEAADAYDQAARLHYGPDAHLNFPKDGEKGVEVSRLQEGLCPEGHSYAVNGYANPRGGTACRICNAAASRRYYARGKAAMAAKGGAA